MRKILILLFAAFISTFAFASGGELERLDKKTIKNMTPTQLEERAIVLENRLLEIQSMDFKSMDRKERKALKSEVRYIEKEARAASNGGIYISTGAVIIILLLIIIL